MATRSGNRRWALLSVAALLLVAGALALWLGTRGSSEPAEEASEPAVLEAVEGTDLTAVRLEPQAVERLDLQTAAVEEPAGASGATGETVVPYSAVLYDTTGGTWVYTSPEPLVFVRARVEVERIEGALAYLSGGPPSGSQVVSVGAAELYGTELGVDH